jgi:hypothetical protein
MAAGPVAFLPQVVRATYDRGFHIRLAFNDGTEGAVDLARWLKGPIFESLEQPAYFRKFFVDGGTVAWPNGAGIAPETLYDAVRSSLLEPSMPQSNHA